VARVVLVDAAGAVAAGKALDIQQSGAVEGFHTRLAGDDDLTRVTGCAVCIVADRHGQPSSEWQGDEALGMIGRAAGYLGHTPIVFAGATHAGVLLAAAREAGVRRTRLIGSAPEAFVAALRAIVAMEARCSPSEVHLAVVGAPPSFVIPWSQASIGGYALEHVLTQVQLTRLTARAARLWPPGPYALGMAAARVAEAVVLSSRRAFNVLSVLGGESEVQGRVGTVPSLLAAPGIVHVRVPSLSTRERVQFETALGD
jgi:malate dehydrogenase